MVPNTKPRPPVLPDDFDQAVRGLLAVKPPPSGKKANADKKKGKPSGAKRST